MPRRWTREIIIANLAKGRLGEAASNLIGSLLITAVATSAMKRSERPEAERQDFVAYLDEFHNFTTDAFAAMLAEARKYGLALVIGHQYLDQVRPAIRAAVFGNAGTLVSFQLGHADAGEIAAELTPYGVDTLTGLGRGEVCVRSVAGSDVAYPFLGRTFPEIGWRYGSRQNALEPTPVWPTAGGRGSEDREVG